MSIYKYKNQIFEIGRAVKLVSPGTRSIVKYYALAFDLHWTENYIIENIKQSNVTDAGFIITINNKDHNPLYFTTKGK